MESAPLKGSARGGAAGILAARDQDELRVRFFSETEIAGRLPADHWAHMPCGHDCCTCNGECK